MRPGSEFLSFHPLPVRSGGFLAGMGLLSLLLLTACARPLMPDEPLPQQFAVLGCLEDCRVTKERCDQHARYDYRQCQAGYARSFQDYRWCLASAWTYEDCGYPWWSCAENLYGYCSNRQLECERACEGAAYPDAATR